MCFSCGEKYSPGHVRAKAVPAQVQAIETVETADVLISDVVLDDIPIEKAIPLFSPGLHAMIDNQVVLILLDSGSSHSFFLLCFA